MLELANHIIKVIKERYGKDLKHWVAAQQDRASTNKGALRTIQDRIPNVRISTNFCYSRTMSNAVKQMTEGKDPVAKYAEDFRKKFQKVIQHPGNARKHATAVFEEPVLDAGGIWFFAKFEQVSQMAKHGLNKIMSQVLPVCKENKWSEESTICIWGR